MWARFFKFISTNLLVAGSLAGFISFVAGTWFVAWKAPDVGSIFSALGRWLRAPAGGTRVDEITLALLAILLGLLGATAIFLRQFSELRRREQQPTPKTPILPGFVPGENQKKVLKLMLQMWPAELDLKRACQLIKGQRTSVEIAQDMYALTLAGVIQTQSAARNEWYRLTNAGVEFARHHTRDTTLP